MDRDLFKRLFTAIFAEDVIALKQLARKIVETEEKKGHNKLAKQLNDIINNMSQKKTYNNGLYIKPNLNQLPISKRNNQPLAVLISRDGLKHHMVLPEKVESRLKRIENEYTARARLVKYNLYPRRKILLHGPPGCGKTMSAERMAWNLGLPLLKVRFDSLISSYFGESATNLRQVFEFSRKNPCVLLLDECDFIAKSRMSGHDVGEAPRIVNMLLTLLDEYDSPGIVIATTNLKITLDEALFRRFDDIIEIPMPTRKEKVKLFKMTLSAIEVNVDIDWDKIVDKTDKYSSANIVSIAQNAAKLAVLEGLDVVSKRHLEKAIEEFTF